MGFIRIGLLLLALAAAPLVAGCQTTENSPSAEAGESAPADWTGYNAPDRLRLDILVVKPDNPAVRLVERARDANSSEQYAALGTDAFELMQDGDVDRADGCVPLRIEFTNPHPAGAGGPFFAYQYADSNHPTRPEQVLSVAEDPNEPAVFNIEGCNGYGSLDVPYEFIREATFMEVGVPGVRTFYPEDTVLGEAGELHKLVSSDKQYMLLLVVLE